MSYLCCASVLVSVFPIQSGAVRGQMSYSCSYLTENVSVPETLAGVAPYVGCQGCECWPLQASSPQLPWPSALVPPYIQ